MYKKDEHDNKKRYYDRILNEIIELGQADKLITGLAFTIQRLVVDHLHVVGDIYDRGPEPDKIMDTLIDYHSVDIQWGNHDVLWLGAYAGSKVCLANIIRICARYNISILLKMHTVLICARYLRSQISTTMIILHSIRRKHRTKCYPITNSCR